MNFPCPTKKCHDEKQNPDPHSPFGDVLPGPGRFDELVDFGLIVHGVLPGLIFVPSVKEIKSGIDRNRSGGVPSEAARSYLIRERARSDESGKTGHGSQSFCRGRPPSCFSRPTFFSAASKSGRAASRSASG